MEIKQRLEQLNAIHEVYKSDLEDILSGNTVDVAPDEISFTVREINRVEKEIAALTDSLKLEDNG